MAVASVETRILESGVSEQRALAGKNISAVRGRRRNACVKIVGGQDRNRMEDHGE